MSTGVDQFRFFVVHPVLTYLGLTSGEELVIGTAAQESNFHYLDQVDSSGRVLGPGIGLYQMEQATHDDIWENFLKYKPDLALKCRLLKGDFPDTMHPLLGNLYYATAMTRVHYYRVKAALPPPTNLIGLASYWKQYYNTTSGAGTIDQFIANYKKYVDGPAH